MKVLFHFLSIFCIVSVMFAAPTGNLPLAEKGVSIAAIFGNGRKLLFSQEGDHGLYLADLDQQRTLQINAEIGGGYRAAWSADGRYVAFKQLTQSSEGRFLQTPCLFDSEAEQILPLTSPSWQCGIPSISGDNKVAFTVGTTLYITDVHGNVQRTFALPVYANQTPLAPDGRSVVYNDGDDQLWLLTLAGGERRKLTTDGLGYFEPIWSPAGDKIVASTLNGKVCIIDVEANKLTDVGAGENPAWSFDGKWLLFSRTDLLENRAVLNMDLVAARSDGSELFRIATNDAWEDSPVFLASNQVLYVDRRSGETKRANWREVGRQFQMGKGEPLPFKPAADKIVPSAVKTSESNFAPVESYSFDIPYLHQAYDTPDWFNGNSACGGTSAVMCLAYYGVINKWPVTVSYPSRHVSDYGRYVCEIYTYNGYTYNIGGEDPSGNIGYGAFGFIIQNHWQDTKGYMSQYARQHGLGSSVDWSPSRAKLRNEADAQMPFVLLNDLTSAGHYISVIGYESEATTVIVNDPWGDKNVAYPSVDGRRAKYDWPGYTNGHANLNTVWCFIYFRGRNPDLLAETDAAPDTATVQQTIPFSGRIISNGFSTAEPTAAKILFSDNSRFDASDLLLATLQIPALAAKDTFEFALPIVVPDSVISGMYGLGVIADADSMEVEASETNNVSYERIWVRGYPNIYGMQPAEGQTVTDSQPTIFAYVTDRVVKVDTSSIRLFLDGREAAGERIAVNSVTFVPQEPLANGKHSVILKVGNQAGFVSRREWSFAVEISSEVNVSAGMEEKEFRLLQSYPNPFNASCKITFILPRNNDVTLRVFAVDGSTIKTMANGPLPAGKHTLVWDGKDDYNQAVASGLYFYQIKAGDFSQTRRMLLLR